MASHGTPSPEFPDWYISFQQAALANLPRPPLLDQDIGLGWADNGKAMKKVLAEALLPKEKLLVTRPVEPVATPAPPTLLPMPADFIPFRMKINGSDPANHPLDVMVYLDSMVYGHRITGITGCKYTGKPIEGEEEATFIWASCGYQKNLEAKVEACIKEAKKRGFEVVPAQGQWREEVIRRYYPNNGLPGDAPLGVPDPSWEDQGGNVFFPSVSEVGDVSFYLANFVLNEHWRLLFRVVRK